RWCSRAGGRAAPTWPQRCAPAPHRSPGRACWIRARACPSSRGRTSGCSGAYRRGGLAGPADTLEVFRVRHAGGGRAAQFRLRSDADWLSAPPLVAAGARETEIPVHYRAERLAAPGLHIGSVTAWNPSDTLAGPLFRLVNVVAVPYDVTAGPLADDSFAAAPAEVRRAFVRVPAGATATF